APSFSAMVSRDSSSLRRAARPVVCSDDALPPVAIAAVIASMAAGCIGVVAAWSRYTERIARPGYRPPRGPPPGWSGGRRVPAGPLPRRGHVANGGFASPRQVTSVIAGQLQRLDADVRDGQSGRHQPYERLPERVVTDVGGHGRRTAVAV